MPTEPTEVHGLVLTGATVADRRAALLAQLYKGCDYYQVKKLECRICAGVVDAYAAELSRGPAAVIEALCRERLALAKLAHPEPMFFNPLEAWGAKDVRDRILKEAGLLHGD